ncbi:MAG TPA: Ig-like domain-containing protein [Myxococcota bacterium]|nr:Ig-like domain-containing protein [Myxococcota bacterium]HRY97016.1 Ig-like domain-containing protein [Myxococcota bacterium]HSA21177.1 Ig-like domain-containing protein [Myxococcota bacterium]
MGKLRFVAGWVVCFGLALGACDQGAIESVSVTLSPETVTLAPGATQAFTAEVLGSDDQRVLFSVEEAGGGSVDGSGRYTAPADEGVYHVVVTSVADATKSDTATVTITANPEVTVTVLPASVTLQVSETQQFSATVTGDANTAVTWSVDEANGCGSVDNLGLYTAPADPATCHVTATSQADPTRSDTASVSVVPAGTCTDDCPVADGVLYGCERRFVYGVNWAWKNWCGDFGGVSAWGFQGVAADREAFSADMAAMKAAGVDVIRWWMFPRFLTESIAWDADDTPSGIGGTLVADIQAALELAEEHDLYLMLTLFSFDSFYSTADEAGIRSRSIQPMVLDPLKRQRLLDNLVRPVAEAVEASPHKQRMLSWDMINEPEWAISGPNPNGGEDFSPNGQCDTVSHAEMETFLDELAATLRTYNPGALLTVGNAAIKWGTAWLYVDQDFYSLHYYDWVYEWFPYDTVTPESIGMTDKPVVLGEYPIQGLSAVGGNPARSAAELSADLWALGWAGTLAWAYNDPSFPWNDQTLGTFADAHPCETAY